MTETPKVGLKLKIFCENLTLRPFLSRSLPPGAQEKAWVKSAGFKRVKDASA